MEGIEPSTSEERQRLPSQSHVRFDTYSKKYGQPYNVFSIGQMPEPVTALELYFITRLNLNTFYHKFTRSQAFFSLTRETEHG